MVFKKGHEPMGGRPKGSKNRATLLAEERRAIFEQRISQKWEEVIDKLPPTYIADQYLGKAPDTLKVEGKIETSDEVVKLAAQAAELLKEKKL